MALTDFVTGLDILQSVLKSAGQSTATTDAYADDAKLAINQEYFSVVGHAQWPWAKATRPGVLTTPDRLRVTVNSISSANPAVVTLSATVAASTVDRKFFLDATQAYYRITAHTAGTATLTLDATYAEDQTAGAASIYQDEFALASDAMIPWTPMRVRGQWERDIDIISEHEWKAKYGQNTIAAIGPPEEAAVLRYDSNGQVVVIIGPWPEESLNIEYQYTRIPSLLTFDGVASTDTPIIPRPYRWIIYQRALSQLFATKNDNLGARAWERAKAGLQEMEARYLYQTSSARLFVKPRFSVGVG